MLIRKFKTKFIDGNSAFSTANYEESRCSLSTIKNIASKYNRHRDSLQAGSPPGIGSLLS